MGRGPGKEVGLAEAQWGGPGHKEAGISSLHDAYLFSKGA